MLRGNLVEKFKRFINSTKNKLYVFTYSSKHKIKIYEYDQCSKGIAENIISKIKNKFPFLKIHFIGSSALGIAGCRDIDIFIESDPADFIKFSGFFEKEFGKPVNFKNYFIEWNFLDNGWEVDILLIDPSSEKFKYQVGIVSFLAENNNFLSKYERLKWKMNGMSEMRYEYEKNKFFSKVEKEYGIENVKFVDCLNILNKKNKDSFNKPSVVIGIPAYNEEDNIGYLLEYLQKQVVDKFIIEKIIVISDGSHDKTNDIVANLSKKFKNIELIADGQRLGKSSRINQLFEKSESDIVVLLDADIKIKNKFVINNLVKPFINNVEIKHISGHAFPLKPVKFIENIVYAGMLIWEYARMNPSASDLYLSEGSIRAFKREVYKKLRFPKSSADEAFSFLFCEKNGYKFYWASTAEVYYRLPNTFNDYMKQMKRFLGSGSIQENIFGSKFLDKYYNIRIQDKLTALAFYLRKNFWWTFLYMLTIPMPRILLLFEKKNEDNGIWEIVSSTKDLKKTSKKNKIVFSNYDDLKNPWYSGGGALAIHEVARRLAKDFEVKVITGKYPKCKDEYIDNVYYQRVGLSFVGPKCGQLFYSFCLPCYVFREKFDIWFESFTPPFTTGLLPFFTRKPVVGVTHMLGGMDMWRKYKIPFYLFERWGFKFYRYFIVLSDILENEIRKYNKIAKIKIIPNGVKLQNKNDFNNQKNIIFIGRIEINQKGLDLLLDSYNKVEFSNRYNLLIAGSGEEKEELILKSKINKFPNKEIKFIGKVTGEGKKIFFQQASFLVMPSRFDTFSLVVLEAFSYGLPVIVFDLENLKWIPDDCAIKVKPFDVDELARAMEKLIIDTDLRKKMGDRAWEFSKNYSWDAVADKYKDYIDNLLKKDGRINR